MFYRGQLCELDFPILDHKQRRPPKKISYKIYATVLKKQKNRNLTIRQWLFAKTTHVDKAPWRNFCIMKLIVNFRVASIAITVAFKSPL